jgi:hypothetical protein
MDFLDVSDDLTSLGDLSFTQNKRFKAYNLLTYKFIESKEIGIDLSILIDNNIQLNTIDSIINRYLTAFNCAPIDFKASAVNKNGKKSINLIYGEHQIEL